MNGWYANYIYNEEINPSFIRDVSENKITGKPSIHLELKGRANAYNDFQILSQVNSVYKFFEKSGKAGNSKLRLSYKINRVEWAEKDISKHENPHDNRLRTGFFRLKQYYNMGYIIIALLKDQTPVFQYDLNFGDWENIINKNSANDPENFKYRMSVFD